MNWSPRNGECAPENHTDSEILLDSDDEQKDTITEQILKAAPNIPHVSVAWIDFGLLELSDFGVAIENHNQCLSLAVSVILSMIADLRLNRFSSIG